MYGPAGIPDVDAARRMESVGNAGMENQESHMSNTARQVIKEGAYNMATT